MSRVVLLLLLVLPALAHAQDAVVPATPVRVAPHHAPAPAHRPQRSLESWIGPLVLGAGGLALVTTALVGLAEVGCDGATCIELAPLPFAIDLIGGAVLIALALAWWLIGAGGVADTAPGGMTGAGDVI